MSAPVIKWEALDQDNLLSELRGYFREHGGVWIRNMPHDAYLKVPAMSGSGIVRFRRSPHHFRNTPDKPPTPAMLLGTALHMRLLEPDRYKGYYVALGQCEGTKADGDRCSYKGKVHRAGQSFCGRHDPDPDAPMDVEVIGEEDQARVEGAAQAVLSHPKAGQFFRGTGWSEVSGFWRDPDTGVACRIRLDRDIERAPVHCDVKLTDDARPHAFHRIAARLGYHIKAAWYRRGMEALGRPALASTLIAVEKGVTYPRGTWEPGMATGPHGVMVYTLDEDQLKVLSLQVEDDLALYRHCVKANEWPAYPEDVRTLYMKDFAMQRDFDSADEEDEDGVEVEFD